MNISRLEPTRQFVTRLVLLNRFHAPDETDYEGARHALAGVHKSFPEAPVHEQAAYLVTHVAAQRAFATGNFRTAWDYMADTLAHKGFDLEATHSEVNEWRSKAMNQIDEEPAEFQAELADWLRSRIHRGL